MDIQLNEQGGSKVAVIHSDTPVITNSRSATDLISDACFSLDCHKVLLHKEQLAADFFELRTGLAGEVLQKFTNYNIRLAIVGDFEHVESKALRDFIRESNKGTQVLFLPDQQTALERLHALP